MAEALTNKTFQFELVSPEKILVSEEVSMVTIPGEMGEFGILADHTSFLSAIKPGVVTVTTPTNETKKIFVSSGFADVNDNVCAVLAEEAVNVKELDLVALQESLTVLEGELSAVQDDDAAKSIQLHRDIVLTVAKIEAVA